MQATIYLCLMDIASGMDYLHSLGVLHGESDSFPGVPYRPGIPMCKDSDTFKTSACASLCTHPPAK